MSKKKLLFLGLVSLTLMLGACGKNNDTGTKAEEASTTEPTLTEQVALNTHIVDSLFNELILIAEEITDSENLENYKSYKLAEIAEGFEPYVANGNIKANVGFVVAEMTSLNSSESIVEIVDALDVYLNQTEEISSTTMAKSYDKNGLNGLSSTLLAKTPEILLSQSTANSYPQFITISHIQDIIESEVNPRLNNIITSLEYIESTDEGQSLLISILDEEWELDIADIYLLDATVHGLRASFKLLTAYNFDMYDPTTKTYSWIDTLDGFESIPSTSEEVTRGDTTVTQRIYYDYTEAEGKYILKLMEYNMGRSDFLTIKRTNHAQAYADLQKVPVKLNKAIDALEAETDSQENDIIKKVDFEELKSDFAEIEADMIDEGFSADLASNFKTPKTMVTFVEELLNGPYTFNENIDGTALSVTMNVSKFFTDPIDDLKNLLPKYKFRDEDDIFEIEIDGDYYDMDGTVSGHEYVDYTLYIFDFVDKDGTVMTIDNMFDNLDEGVVPYFDDYTFNGIFPGMTRTDWNNLAKVFY